MIDFSGSKQEGDSRRRALSLTARLIVFTAIACSAGAAVPRTTPPVAKAAGVSTREVRIALAEAQAQVRLTASGAWQIYAGDGRTPVALTQPGEQWILERDARGIAARREDSRPVTGREQVVVVRALDGASQITFNGKRWRGDLVISASTAGLLVVNRLPMDDYIKGVVPLEIGTSSPADAAAIEAQAITARSYAVTHLAGASRPFDMRATVNDQVYGGASAETRVGNLAVEATAGLVLLYEGRVVNAPYSSTCGGSTAEPQDVWRAGAGAYLKRVSDQIPGTTRFYCDGAPKYRWTRTYAREELRQTVTRYLRTLPGRDASIGLIRAVTVTDVTPAGRIGVLTIDTDRGAIALRGNDIRNALRLPSGEILYSTYFSVNAVTGREGIETLSLRGGGNGHGVGMCQTGAIGRARAGQDFRTILRTYYPGTTVGTID